MPINIITTPEQKYAEVLKKAKDVAAGAVLVGALTATIVGTIIFLPYFLNLLFFFV